MFNAFADDVAQTFNTVQPIVYGGTGSNDLKLTDTDFGIKDNGDPTKIGQFNASNLPTATTRTYDLPYYSGTLGLVSDIRGQIYGLTLSNNVTDATNDIDIAAGAAVDSTGTVSMLLASAYTKRLDAAWAVGTNQGGRMSAAAIANTTYHVFLIRRPDTGVVDVGFDVSPTAPTLPTNYTQFRRIGSIVRAAGTIVAFKQFGNEFTLDVPVFFDSGTNPGVGSVLVTLPNIPSGIRVLATLAYYIFDSSAANYTYMLISDPATSVTAASVNAFSVSTPSNTGNVVGSSRSSFRTNGGSQVRVGIDFSDAGVSYRLVVVGWVDDLGRQL